MKNEYKSLIISAILPLVLSLLGQIFFIYFFSDEGKIQIVSNVMKNQGYQTIISIKNMKTDEYLKNLEIILDSDVDIIEAKIDGEEIVGEKLTFKEISPKSISTLIVLSKQELTKDNITIIKNGAKITVENFNNATNYKIVYLIIALTYFIINFFTCIWLDSKNKKVREEIKKQIEEVRKNSSEEVNRHIVENKKRTEKCEKELQELIKENNVNKMVYLKEMNEMEKEVKFYQRLILKCVNKEMSKVELEKLISKELKTFTGKKMKHISYEDVYKIVNELSFK